MFLFATIDAPGWAIIIGAAGLIIKMVLDFLRERDKSRWDREQAAKAEERQQIIAKKLDLAGTERQENKAQTVSAVRAVAAVAHEAKEAALTAVKGNEDTKIAINGRVEQLIAAAGAVGEAKGAADERVRVTMEAERLAEKNK